MAESVHTQEAPSSALAVMGTGAAGIAGMSGMSATSLSAAGFLASVEGADFATVVA